LSRDGRHLAMTDWGQQLVLASVPGPAWSGEPPYAEPDYVDPSSDLQAPTIVCRGAEEKTDNPSWSMDGSLVAYGAPHGVHVMNPDCTGDRLIAPGGSDPAFGPADVVPPPAAAVKTPPPSASAPALKLSAVSLRPRTFSARAGTTVRFTLSAAARV